MGDEALVARLRRNPLKRALRVDKMTLAALEAVLRLYRHPDALAESLPALRLLCRPAAQIEAVGRRVLPAVVSALPGWDVRLEPTASQIGSGALPVDRLPSWALAIRPARARRGGLDALARRLRQLPIPVIGRVQNEALVLDLRTLEDEAGFTRQLPAAEMAA